MKSIFSGAQTSLAAGQSFGVVARDAAVPGALTALYERVCAGTPGFLRVETASLEASRALAEYLLRVGRTSGAVTLAAAYRPGAPLWHEVRMKLSSASQESVAGGCLEPGAAAAQLVSAARGRSTLVVVPMAHAHAWDSAVATELARKTHPFVAVALVSQDSSEESPWGADVPVEVFDVTAKLSAGERESWWSVAAETAASQTAGLGLIDLEGWWAHVGRANAAWAEGAVSTPPRALSSEESSFLGALSLAGRPWPVWDVAALGGTLALVSTLVREGRIRRDLGWLTRTTREGGGPETPAGDAVSAEDASRVADALVAHAAQDPWALTRAAELFAKAGDLASADRTMELSLAQVEDSLARRELVTRWTVAVQACPPADRLVLQRRGVERALAVGEAEEAYQWARAASAAAPYDASVALLLGRALVALGDLVAAEVTLRKGALAASPTVLAFVSAELAEVAYLKGDMAAASRLATEALEAPEAGEQTWEATAKARNTLGKILLADGRWDAADGHFAEDALAAAGRGDVTGELRARLNRGIAFLSNGSLDEARAIFESVRTEGEHAGDFRASAFALDNLAVVAMWRHDYAEALSLSERTLTLRRRLGDRLTTARIVGNLAELRRKLGLLEHADHAIAFGRRALGPGMPPERSAHFSFVAARVALDRGHTEAAHREIERAVRDAELTGHKRLLAEAHRVSARIALEDGDLARAREALRAATPLATTDEARAEVGLLDALLERALGADRQVIEQRALEALRLARVAGEEETLLGAYILLAELYRSEDQLSLARSHAAQATTLRDQVTRGLPADVTAAFLARRDVRHLARLESSLAAAAEESGLVLGGRSSDERDGFDPSSSRDISRPSLRPSSPSMARALPPTELVGADGAMRALQVTIKKVARSNSTVLIRGESGTGKELVAAALHRASDRASGPMVTVNCAALVETLLLSELFGHEKGAFTGAAARKRGRFELAEGGTLFLDEIGDISAKTQVALLRVLQERTFERVGGNTPIRVDVHIICATHRDLRAMVERGEFREDLYYRLRGIALDVPALRARPGDLPALADHLLGRIALERAEGKKALSADALELLTVHTWPGNVRELENALRAASLFADGDIIRACDLTENVDDLRRAAERAVASRTRLRSDAGRPLRSAPPPASGASDEVDETADDDEASSEDLPLPGTETQATAVAYAQIRGGTVSLSDMKRQIERDCIVRALSETRGNITRAASLLGMKRPRLSQLVKHYGLSAVSSEVS